MVEHVAQLIKKDAVPQPWWKFTIKACYVRVIILASLMEFATPKSLMETFVAEAVTKCVEHFYGEDQVNNYLVF